MFYAFVLIAEKYLMIENYKFKRQLEIVENFSILYNYSNPKYFLKYPHSAITS